MINIVQNPNQLTLANSNLVWVMSSNSGSRPQFQYITYLQDSGSNTLTTIKQQPNTFVTGVFDMGRIVRNYLDFDVYASQAGSGSNLFNKSQQGAGAFKFIFSEEWGTTSTSVVVTASNPAGVQVTASNMPYYYLINGTLDPNYGSFNWFTSSYYKPQVTPNVSTFKFNVALTEASRTQSCFPYDYMSVGLLNGNLTASSTQAQDIYCMKLDVFSGSTNVYTNTIFNVASTTAITQGGPRSSATQLWSAIAGVPTGSNTLNKQSQGTFLIYAGIGPQNLTDQSLFNFNTGSWDYYTVKFLTQQAASTPNQNGIWDQFTIYNQSISCGYEPVRFAWINDLGTWDYYNFTLAKSDIYDLEKATYKANFVDYSTRTTSPYDIKRRGTTVFDTRIVQTETVVSNWLTQEESDWLTKLFYSPNVYIQQGKDMIPIWIDTTQVQTKTNVRTQKLFTYTVSYKIANQKRSR